MEEDEISYKVIGAAIEVHKTLGGPGLLEGVYESSPIHKVQLLTYLRITGKKLGLLINFGRESVKEGISRIVNGL